ncbi:MAG: peptide ABC transporter substrate-binding protein, partial [Candidatus Accumulibacter sp.]|nr:peptide ABC transporter substrate-binding protein [Accumulibacter sp.]
MSRRYVLFLLFLLAACASEQNDPYPSSERGGNILYMAFNERPKHIDPARSYTEDGAVFTAQIYEPPLQYHYLKRPYTLIPGTAESVPEPEFYDATGERLPADAPPEAIHHSVYEIRIRPGILYQPHPAFAVDADGRPVYADLDAKKLADIDTLADFAQTGTRELVADDYIYEIKRLAHPRVHSPIFGMMAARIVGLKELGQALQKATENLPEDAWLDLDR